ncbi:MAG: class I SAM-dependent methyltransferase [Acidobacteria bacterium]|nr:class I SAM-dependent methyltransferase [Acidobacteriota bacterium]
MTQKEFGQRLARRAKRAGLTLNGDLPSRLWTYFDLLFRWNAKINLTSLTPDAPDEAVDRLLIEPLVAARHVGNGDARAIDIGSGGGSPGIPLMLAASQIRLVMVESKARKSAFLREALRQLGAGGSVETARFEELLSRPEFHETFDLLTLRAVRTDARTLAGLQAFVRPAGRLFLFGGPMGDGQPPWLVPPLRWKETLPLTVESVLTVLEKLRIP